uniref:LIM zinc-binding domain-containing protein n=1 Tax=Caenorhabditis japonica TaxID=281687 RepID=A0A8R1IL72_CAEJA
MDRSIDRRLCGHCHQSIGSEALVAMNRLWHPDHFTCSSCKRPIKQTFQAADNHAYCVQCFAQKSIQSVPDAWKRLSTRVSWPWTVTGIHAASRARRAIV